MLSGERKRARRGGGGQMESHFFNLLKHSHAGMHPRLTKKEKHGRKGLRIQAAAREKNKTKRKKESEGKGGKRKMGGSDKKLEAEAAHVEIITPSDWRN